MKHQAVVLFWIMDPFENPMEAVKLLNLEKKEEGSTHGHTIQF